jgi:phosphoglycolate phosphatase-like HAD superfamily hydrolase
MDYQSNLKNFTPQYDFFIGIDSDGCVFDTMEAKQKQFFIPNALKYFDLYKISEEVRETWEFVNLYSVYRGGNRFTSLLKVFELLRDRKSVGEKKCVMPDLSALREWISTETKLSNDNLLRYFESNYDPDLEKVVRWTQAINLVITHGLKPIPPFTHAGSAIEKMSRFADLVIVSQTPLEALEREWKEHKLERYVKVMAGQEHGTKTEHIALASKNKYNPEKILMIGDAKGDLDAARNNKILFYPVIPGNEAESWKRLVNEGLKRFTGGLYRGSYENKLIAEFEESLPSRPPWTD